MENHHIFFYIMRRSHCYIIYNWQTEVALKQFGIGPRVRSLFLICLTASLDSNRQYYWSRVHPYPFVYLAEVNNNSSSQRIRNKTQINTTIVLFALKKRNAREPKMSVPHIRPLSKLSRIIVKLTSTSTKVIGVHIITTTCRQ